MDYQIRKALPADAAGISRVVIATLRESNAADYDEHTIQRVERSFSEPAVLALLTHRLVFVTVVEGEVLATASLEDDVVRSVFVAPSRQGLGIGARLMQCVEHVAIAQGLQQLRVPSSTTAQGFYARLGYSKVRDEFHGAERTVVMHKRL